MEYALSMATATFVTFSKMDGAKLGGMVGHIKTAFETLELIADEDERATVILVFGVDDEATGIRSANCVSFGSRSYNDMDRAMLSIASLRSASDPIGVVASSVTHRFGVLQSLAFLARVFLKILRNGRLLHVARGSEGEA